MNRFILASTIAFLTPRFLLAAPDDNKGGGGKPLSLEERLTKATDELTKINGELKTANDTIGNLTKERDDAKSELTTVKSQFGELTKATDKLKTELATANDTIGNLTKERDAVKGDLAKANDNVSRLETLCGVKGVSATQAVSSVPVEPAPISSMADWDAKMKAAKTPEDRARVGAAFHAAFAAGQVK